MGSASAFVGLAVALPSVGRASAFVGLAVVLPSMGRASGLFCGAVQEMVAELRAESVKANPSVSSGLTVGGKSPRLGLH